MELGKFIRQRRLKLDMSQEDVARKADLSVSTVSRIESGAIAQPRKDNLDQLAKALEVPPKELYWRAGYHVPDYEPVRNPIEAIEDLLRNALGYDDENTRRWTDLIVAHAPRRNFSSAMNGPAARRELVTV